MYGIYKEGRLIHVTIHSQEELDEVPEDYTESIVINFGTEEKRAILDRELSARIIVLEEWVIEIRKPNNVHAWDNSSVYAWNKDKVWSHEDARVYNLEED